MGAGRIDRVVWEIGAQRPRVPRHAAQSRAAAKTVTYPKSQGLRQDGEEGSELTVVNNLSFSETTID